MDVDNWVAVDGTEVTLGPILWRGPGGEGNLWTPNDDGTVYTSELNEVRTAPDDFDQWTLGSVMALAAYAAEQGYTVREQPHPPQEPDSDGDGVPDSQDADPYDPNVQ